MADPQQTENVENAEKAIHKPKDKSLRPGQDKSIKPSETKEPSK